MTRSVATETEVKVEIDQQTKDELQPPCEGGWPTLNGRTPCRSAADWVCSVACEHCGPRVALDCNAHLKAFMTVGVLCRRCRAAGRLEALALLSTEPLR
jgi:hypothetical protein